MFCRFWQRRPGLAAAEKYTLRAGHLVSAPVRVTANLDVGGYLKTEVDKKPQQIPMSVVAQFTYDEHRIDDGSDVDHRLASAITTISRRRSKSPIKSPNRSCATIAA